MKATVTIDNNKIKVRLPLKEGEKIHYQDLKQTAAALGMKVIGKSIEDLKAYILEHQDKKEPQKEKAAKKATGPRKSTKESNKTEEEVVFKKGVAYLDQNGVGNLWKHERAQLMFLLGNKEDKIAAQLKMSLGNVKRALWMHRNKIGITREIVVK